MSSRVLFTGLCVFAPEGLTNNGAQTVRVYLVDARMKKKSCGSKKLPLSEHRPLLSFDPVDLVAGSTKGADEIVPAPSGGEVHLCHLDLETLTIQGTGEVKLDPDFGTCVPSLRAIDMAMERLRTSEAITEVSMQSGTLSPIDPSTDKWEIGNSKLSLANGVRLELTGGIEIRFDGGKVLKLKDGARATVSNLPTHPPMPHGNELPHFLWYYRLAGWKSGVCKDHMPKKSPAAPVVFTAGSGICPPSQWP